MWGAEKWTLPKANQKYMERTEMWCLKRIEKKTSRDRHRVGHSSLWLILMTVI